jgi:putative thioredoxin
MNSSPNIVDSSTATFQADAIDSSRDQLVMVDFWAEWCGPCRSLTPILEKLVGQYNGTLKLVKVNTDENQDLAGHFGIRSLPTVFFIKNGEVADQFMGLKPESEINSIIEKHADAPPESPLDQIIALHSSGDVEAALASINQLIIQNPSDDQPKLVIAGWLIDLDRLEEAGAMIETISENGQSSPEYKALAARMEFSGSSDHGPGMATLLEAIAKNENDLDARFQLANDLVRENRLEEALMQLLEIIKRDRNFGDDAPRKTMIKIFELCGGQGDIVSRYRRALLSLLN